MTVTAATEPPVVTRKEAPTIWGCTPEQAHNRFWAAFGVQVVRRGERSQLVEDAELFLLCEPGTLVLFRLDQVLDTLYWVGPDLMTLRVHESRPRAYREIAVDRDGKLVRFERIYRDAHVRTERIALTPSRELATMWQNALSSEYPWRWLRMQVPKDRRLVRRAKARLYEMRDDAQIMECVRDLMRYWKRPDTTIRRAHPLRDEVVMDISSRVDDGAVFLGPVWVGAGRRVEAGTHVVGPAVLWDDPAVRPPVEEVRWLDLEPTQLATSGGRSVRTRHVPGKRLFDVAFALVALAVTLPLYPFIALAILLEDGRPIFFAHRRETIGGREFPCLKFRSMRKSADVDRDDLRCANQADGPQFFIKDDPRVTRTGRILRRFHLDELPQFLNVLVGHMSVVGPRPSPYAENQYCPPWREARLSVRPGVTGLWQVRRTRRKGLDFQEWIRFDMEYVENASWSTDLKVIAETLGVIVSGILK